MAEIKNLKHKNRKKKFLLQPNPKNQTKKEIKVQTLSKRRVQGLERTNKKRQKKNVKK